MVLPYISDVVGFLVVLYVLWRFAVPPIRRLMAAQQEQIRARIEQSEQTHTRLEQADAEYNRVTAEARVDAATMRNDARGQSEHIVAELDERGRSDAERIVEGAHHALDSERDALVRRLRADAGAHAVALAEQLVRAELADEGRRHASVDRFLAELAALGDDSRAGASIGEGV